MRVCGQPQWPSHCRTDAALLTESLRPGHASGAALRSALGSQAHRGQASPARAPLGAGICFQSTAPCPSTGGAEPSLWGPVWTEDKGDREEAPETWVNGLSPQASHTKPFRIPSARPCPFGSQASLHPCFHHEFWICTTHSCPGVPFPALCKPNLIFWLRSQFCRPAPDPRPIAIKQPYRHAPLCTCLS